MTWHQAMPLLRARASSSIIIQGTHSLASAVLSLFFLILSLAIENHSSALPFHSQTFRKHHHHHRTMTTTSFRISGLLLSPSLCSPNLDHHPRISFLKPLNSHQAPRVSVVKSNFPNYRTKATVNGNLETVGVPTSVPVRVAHELLLAGHRYLDVRTPEEFYAGHVPGATNIPYMYRFGSGMTKNANFVAEVSSRFRKDDEIIVGCQLGKRSMMAATDLLAAGFSAITDIAGGYAAWTQNGLPTEQ